MPIDAVHVDPGFTWTSAFSGVGAAGILGLLIRQIGPWRQQTTDAETRMRQELATANTALGERIDRLQVQLSRTERRHDAHIEIIGQLHAAELAAMRHRLGNETQANAGMLAAIGAGNLERLEKVVEKIQADRARREENIARETAELVKLRVVAMDKIEKLRAADPTEPAAKG